MSSFFPLDKLLNKLAHGVPIRTACSVLRIPYTQFKSLYVSNEAFALDVEQAIAQANEQIILLLYSEATMNAKIALEYLKKRDAENWSDVEKREIIREQERILLLELLRDNLPLDIFNSVVFALEQSIGE